RCAGARRPTSYQRSLDVLFKSAIVRTDCSIFKKNIRWDVFRYNINRPTAVMERHVPPRNYLVGSLTSLLTRRNEMKKQLLLLAVFAMSTFAFSSSAVAQTERAPNNALSAGEHSLSFSVPTFGDNPYAGGAFGYWMMLTPNVNL